MSKKPWLHQTVWLGLGFELWFIKLLTKTKENPAIGYMKRIKQNWDIIHPEFSHLSDKNLRDQTSRIIKNKIVMETEFSTDSNTNWNFQIDLLICHMLI